MRVKFFAIPALDPAGGEAELNAFLAQHHISSIDRELVTTSQGVFWMLAVTYVDSASRVQSASRAARDKTDYKEVLTPEDFQVYAELRRLRKELAEREGVPLYALFSNKQLAAMAQQRTASLEELRRIEGVGEARTQKYGKAFLAAIGKLGPPEAPAKDSKQDSKEGDAPDRDSPR